MTLPDSEVPGILVALPGLKDSYFEKTVILLCNYNEEGAMGLVMNHTSGSQVRQLLKEETSQDGLLNIPLLLGGPVQPEMFWAVHGPDYEGESTTTLSPGSRLSSAKELIDELETNGLPETCHMGCGYSGWGPQQLDGEIQHESWWLGPLDEELLMEMDYGLRWETTLKNLGIDPLTAGFISSGTV